MARRRRLFWKYVFFFSLLVTVALLASGLVEIYFSYQESKEVLSALQREKAQAAAVRIEGFITEIEHQMGWVTQPRRHHRDQLHRPHRAGAGARLPPRHGRLREPG